MGSMKASNDKRQAQVNDRLGLDNLSTPKLSKRDNGRPSFGVVSLYKCYTALRPWFPASFGTEAIC